MKQFIEISDKNIYYQLIGTPDYSNSNLMVFLHEGLGSIGQWKDFPEKLSTILKTPALVYDRYGYGKSEPLKEERQIDYLHKEAEYLKELLEKLGINQKVILFGHSDGASIALIFAALYPEKVLNVISEAAHVFIEDISVEGISNAKKLFQQGRLKESLDKYHGDNTEKMFYSWADRWLTPQFKNWNIENLLPDITCPVLIIQGENDQYGTLKQVESIDKNVTGKTEKLILPDCGHIPHFEKEEIVIDKVERFISIGKS